MKIKWDLYFVKEWEKKIVENMRMRPTFLRMKKKKKVGMLDYLSHTFE